MGLLAERNIRKAHEVIARDYAALKGEVLRSVRTGLRNMRVPFNEHDLDAAYNNAWHTLYSRLATGDDFDKPGGFLVEVTKRRVIDEARRARHGLRADAVDIGERGYEHDYVSLIDNRRLIREFTEGLREKLTERECQVVTLCWIEGYTRPEAARILELPEDRVQKIMDSATPKIGEFAQVIREGGWCEEHASMMRAFARDWLKADGDRYKLAKRHLEDCPSCRRFVRALKGLSGLIPPVLIPTHGAGHASPTWHGLNHGVHGAWHHHINLIGPHVIVAKSSAATGASAGAGAGKGALSGGATAAGSGLFASAGSKLGAGLAIAVAGGSLALVGQPSGHAAKPPTRPRTLTQAAVTPAAPRPLTASSGRVISVSNTHATSAGRKTAKRSARHRTKQRSAPQPNLAAPTEFLPETQGTQGSTTSTSSTVAKLTPAPPRPAPVTSARRPRSSTSSGTANEFTFEGH
jgi:DNA-directed RNA polymerase specialized sigma24 family protein